MDFKKRYNHVWAATRPGSGWTWVVNGTSVYNTQKKTVTTYSSKVIEDRLHKISGEEAETAIAEYIEFVENERSSYEQFRNIKSRFQALQKDINHRSERENTPYSGRDSLPKKDSLSSSIEKRAYIYKSKEPDKDNARSYSPNGPASKDGFNYIETFFKVSGVVLVLNQLGYSMCFMPYCIMAAVPKVVIISLIITACLYLANRR